MTSTIYIDIDGDNTKVAITEDGRLAEFYYETPMTSPIVGNIYKARVVNVVPGMQAAFCDIGLEKNAYMSDSDSLFEQSELDGVAQNDGSKRTSAGYSENDIIMAQVVKEGNFTKGARVTPNISIPGRLLVMTPKMDYIGISRKIEDERIREKLLSLITSLKPEGAGYIVRTQCKDAGRKEIEAEMESLHAIWKEILKKYNNAKVCDTVYRESGIVSRTLRDYNLKSVNKIIVNDAEAYDFICNLIKPFVPKPSNTVTLYDGQRDMLTHYNLTTCVDKLTKRRASLKCGGYLVIDKTEALTVIDVNSGRFTGDNNLEETVFKVNFDACSEIAHQIRLRNISGIIIVDFIDMNDETHKERVIAELRDCLKNDRVKTSVAGMTKLGLVEITRKKILNEAGEPLTAGCPYCDDDNRVYSSVYLATKIKAALIDIFIEPDPRAVLIYVSDKIFGELNESRFLSRECESKWSKKRIYLAPDERLHMSHYRIQILPNGNILDLPDAARMLY